MSITDGAVGSKHDQYTAENMKTLTTLPRFSGPRSLRETPKPEEIVMSERRIEVTAELPIESRRAKVKAAKAKAKKAPPRAQPVRHMQPDSHRATILLALAAGCRYFEQISAAVPHINVKTVSSSIEVLRNKGFAKAVREPGVSSRQSGSRMKYTVTDRGIKESGRICSESSAQMARFDNISQGRACDAKPPKADIKEPKAMDGAALAQQFMVTARDERSSALDGLTLEHCRERLNKLNQAHKFVATLAGAAGCADIEALASAIDAAADVYAWEIGRKFESPR